MNWDTLYWTMLPMALLTLLFGGIVYLAYTDGIAQNRYNSFCQDNGYDMVIREHRERKVDGELFIQCLDEEIINKELVKIKEWLLYEEGP